MIFIILIVVIIPIVTMSLTHGILLQFVDSQLTTGTLNFIKLPRIIISRVISGGDSITVENIITNNIIKIIISAS